MSKLKKCPFCGGEAAYTQILGNYERPHEVYCTTCDGGITEGRSKDGVIHNWNARPIEDELRKRIAELEAEQARWVMVSERLPNESGWYLAGLIGWAGGYYTAEVHFDTETGLPWRSSVRDEVYCWLDGVPELPKPPEVENV